MKTRNLIIFIPLLFTVHSCFTPKLTANIEVGKKLNNPIMLDFVFIFDSTALDELQKIPALQWFNSREQFKADLELSDKIQILSYELVPGQKIEINKFKPKFKSEAMIVYASYLTQGDHRIILKDFSNLTLYLQQDEEIVVFPGSNQKVKKEESKNNNKKESKAGDDFFAVQKELPKDIKSDQLKSLAPKDAKAPNIDSFAKTK